MPNADPKRSELTVLARPSASTHNPYTNLLYRELGALGVKVEAYSPLSRFATHHIDVFHVHWPESVYNHGLLQAEFTTRWLLGTMRQLKDRGTKLLFTVHNLRSHDRRHPKAEAAFWQRFIGHLDGFIALSKSGKRAAEERFPKLAELPGFVTLHPHYRGVYADRTTRSEARSTFGFTPSCKVLLFIGTIAPYKNVPALIRALGQLRDPNVRLLIAGKPRTPNLGRDVRRALEGESRARCHLNHVPNDELQLYLRAADLVVLPFEEVLNSGSAILSLSFDRPVLLPDLGSAQDLRANLGDDWVKLYNGELTGEHLSRALDAVSPLPERTQGEHLGPLEPSRVAESTLESYRLLIA